MRLLSLELLAFGPFTETILDFSDGDAGVHLIHGPNEAGKSAALRGLTNLFYGIPPRTTDNFIHANPDLRIGAEILHSDGKTSARVIRRKGNKNTLLDASGNSLQDDVLDNYLGGVTRELFTTMYGIDQGVLVRGGKALVEGGGDLGESLFAAGMGVAGMKEVMAALEAEAGGLFKPKARNPLINSLISAFKDARKQCVGKSLSPAEWARHDRSLRGAEKEKREVEKTLGALLSERNRFERLQKAIPRIVAMRGLRAELETMGDAPVLPPDCPGERRTARETLHRARTARERLEKELASIRASISAISPSDNLLKAQDDINNLFQRSGSHKKAQLDLPRRRADYYRLREEAEAILKQMGPEFTLDNAEALRLTDARIARIQKLGRELDPLLERIRSREKDKANLEADLAAARKDLAGTPAEMNAGKLEEACARARRQGDLAARLQKTTADLKKRRKRAENALVRLGLWKGPLEKVETLAAPAPETVDRFEADFHSVAGRMERIENDISEQRDRISLLNRQIEEVKAGGSIPAEEDLAAARERRDQGWRLIRGAWLLGRSDPEGIRAFVPGAEDAPKREALADEYVKSVARADEVGDRLRNESERVAKLAEFAARKREREKRLEARRRELAKVLEHSKTLAERWSAMWADIGIAPLSPREMGAWLQRLQNVTEAAADLRERNGEKDEIEAVIEALRSDVSVGLKGLGEWPAWNKEKLESLIHRAESKVKSVREAARVRESLSASIQELERGRTLADMDLKQAGEARKSWLMKWGEAMRPLGLDKDSLPEEADAVLTRTRLLFERLDQSRVMQGRIRAMEADAKKFEEEVAGLCARLAADLAEIPPDEAVSLLYDRLRKDLTGAARLGELEKRRGAVEKTIYEEGIVIDETGARLEEMRIRAGAASLDELPEIERKSAEVQEKRKEMERLERELAEYSAGADIATFIRETEAVDFDALSGEIEERSGRIRTLEEKRSELDQIIGGERAAFKLMDGGADASELAGKSQAILAETRDAVERYARVRIASIVLRKEIERYREANQGPILGRAGEIFNKLTLNSFSGLAPEYDEKDNPILKGVRPSREKIPVEGMSDGARDQLYLALRLASIEQRLQTVEPIPLILDDILINFDDDRSKATMTILADLSRKTQVIFFTHHQHLVDLARSAMGKDKLFTHALDSWSR